MIHSPFRWPHWLLTAVFCLAFCAPGMEGQSTPSQSPPAPKDENPFPGDAPQAPAKAALPNAAPKPGQTAKPDFKPEGDNPFPGEDPNVPIIPAPGTPQPGAPASEAGSGARADAARTPRRDFDPDGDPVRSPDAPGNYTSDDGFSSSRTGLKQLPSEDVSDGAPGKSIRNKTRGQEIEEDLEVGNYYLDRKNWKAAQGRFASAFELDRENPDAVWGLAEAERHLQLYREAAAHYRLFLTYDPDGRHGREARRALGEVEAAKPGSPEASKPGDGMQVQPK